MVKLHAVCRVTWLTLVSIALCRKQMASIASRTVDDPNAGFVTNEDDRAEIEYVSTLFPYLTRSIPLRRLLPPSYSLPPSQTVAHIHKTRAQTHPERSARKRCLRLKDDFRLVSHSSFVLLFATDLILEGLVWRLTVVLLILPVIHARANRSGDSSVARR